MQAHYILGRHGYGGAPTGGDCQRSQYRRTDPASVLPCVHVGREGILVLVQTTPRSTCMRFIKGSDGSTRFVLVPRL